MAARKSWEPQPIAGTANLTEPQLRAIRGAMAGRINAGNFDLWLDRYSRAFPNARYHVRSVLVNLLTQADRDAMIQSGRFQKARGVGTFGHFVKELGKAGGQVADMAAMVTAVVPGVGPIVSSTIAAVSAIGRGESLKNIALKTIRGALPGGALTQAAFDVGVGVASGQRPDRAVLSGVRSQIKAGPIAQAAFDAGVAAVQGRPAGQILAHVATAALPKVAPSLPAFKVAHSLAQVVTQGTTAAAQWQQGARTVANSGAMQSAFAARKSLAVIVKRAQNGHPVALQVVTALQHLPRYPTQPGRAW